MLSHDADFPIANLFNLQSSDLTMVAKQGHHPVVSGVWADRVNDGPARPNYFPHWDSEGDGLFSTADFDPAYVQLLTVEFWRTRGANHGGNLRQQLIPRFKTQADLNAYGYGYVNSKLSQPSSIPNSPERPVYLKLPTLGGNENEHPDNYRVFATHWGTFMSYTGDRLFVKGIRFENWGDRAFDLRGDGCVFRDCEFHMTRRSAVRNLGGDQMIVEDCLFEAGVDWLTWQILKGNNVRHGSPITPPVINTQAESSSTLKISGGKNHRISNNRFTQVGDALIFAGSFSEISGNEFFECLDDGINVADKNHVVHIFNNRLDRVHTAYSPSTMQVGPVFWINNGRDAQDGIRTSWLRFNVPMPIPQQQAG